VSRRPGQRIDRVCFPRDALIDRNRQALQPIVAEQRLDARTRPADVGRHQVDLRSHTPGAIVWPPEVWRVVRVIELIERCKAALQEPHRPIREFEARRFATGEAIPCRTAGLRRLAALLALGFRHVLMEQQRGR
jgi:hypothetical protein